MILYVGRLDGFPLQDPDEGRYAEIPREMIEHGDWVTPRLNYVEYFEKPPLFYWLVAMAFRAFGTSEGSARLVPALAGLATIAVSYFLAHRLFGRRAALVSAATLATAPLFFVFSQALVIDMLMTLLITACLAAIWGAREDPEGRGWPIVVACTAALAVLTKGLIGLVLPGLVIVLLVPLERDWRLLRSLLRPAPAVAFLAIAAPWFILMAARHPEFLREFFVVEQLQRFATATVGHPEGPLYYVPVLAVGLLPWTLLAGVLSCTRRGRSAWRKIRGAETRFLSVWVLVVVVFFSIASSKLAGYVLPAVPPAMLLLGAWIDRLDAESSLGTIAAVRGTAGYLLVLGLVLLAAGIALPLLVGALPRDVVLQSGFALQRVRIILVLGSAAALIGGGLCARRTYVTTYGLSGTVITMAVALALVLLPLVSARSMVKTSRRLAATISREARPEDLVVQYRTLMQGLLFYLGERIVQIDECGEIRRGADRAPDRDEYFWQGTERLEREWRSGRGVFIVTNRRYVSELGSKLVPEPRIVAEDGQQVLLDNRPPAKPVKHPAARPRLRQSLVAEGACSTEPRNG